MTSDEDLAKAISEVAIRMGCKRPDFAFPPNKGVRQLGVTLSSLYEGSPSEEGQLWLEIQRGQHHPIAHRTRY